MPKNLTFFLVVSTFLAVQIGGHRNGGPIEACRTLVPDHEGMEPLDGAASNYFLEVEPQEDGAIEVILRGGTFKGEKFDENEVLVNKISLKVCTNQKKF